MIAATKTEGSQTLRLLFSVAVSMVMVLSLGACAPQKPDLVPSDSASSPSVTVYAIDNRFEPQHVEIEVGQSVRWVFQGTSEHDVVAKDGSFVSELMVTGEYLHEFDAAGTFAYDCSIHPEMIGSVTVR